MKKALIILLALAAFARTASAAVAICGTPVAGWSAAITSGGVAIAPPTGCSTTGQAVLAHWFVAYNQGSGAAVNTPAGLTADSGNPYVVASNINLYHFYANVAASGSIPSPTFTVVNTGFEFGGYSYAQAGFNTSAPFEGTPTLSSLTTAASTIPTPGITTTTANDGIIDLYFCFHDEGGATTFAVAPGGTIEASSLNRSVTSSNLFMVLADWTLASPGASGVNTLSGMTFGGGMGSSGAPRVGISFAVKPTAGAVATTSQVIMGTGD